MPRLGDRLRLVYDGQTCTVVELDPDLPYALCEFPGDPLPYWVHLNDIAEILTEATS